MEANSLSHRRYDLQVPVGFFRSLGGRSGWFTERLYRLGGGRALRYLARPMDLIHVKGLELRCIVGIRSYERRREQPLRVDVSLGLDLSTAGRSGRIGDSVDYATVADQVTALLRFREYRLLEVAAEEATAFLFAAHPALRQVQLRLDKPEALAGRARSAAVEMTRTRGAFGASDEETDYGVRSELLRSPEGIVERVLVRAGHSVVFSDEHNRLESIVDGPAKGRLVVIGRGEKSTYQANESSLLLCRCVALPDPPSELSGEE